MARVLFVTSRLPYPPVEGHQLRAWHLLRAVASRHEVILLSLRRPEDPARPDPALTGILHECHLIDLPSARRPTYLAWLGLRHLAGGRPLLDLHYSPGTLRRAFDGLARQVDLVHLDILAVAGLIDRVPAGTPVILNEHNVESRLAAARVDIENHAGRRFLRRLQGRGLARFEHAVCNRATTVLTCSEVDRKHLAALAPAARLQVIPNGVDLERFQPGEARRERSGSLVFVGQMSWFPNRDGIEFFLREVMPKLAPRADFKLQVIGRNGRVNAPPELADRVHFTGFVDDPRPIIQQSAVYIVPLRAGSGTRLKILEAMALGKAIVSTRIGAEGIGLNDGQNALLADTPEEFARAVECLLDSPELRRKLGREARRMAESHFGWNAIGDQLLTTYDQVLDDSGPGLAAAPSSAAGYKKAPA